MPQTATDMTLTFPQPCPQKILPNGGDDLCQEDDYGTFMCYATNSLGSVQKLLEVKLLFFTVWL